MNNECHRHEKDLKCPLCRAVLLEYYNDLSGNTLHELNIESDIENHNEVELKIMNQDKGIIHFYIYF